MLVRNRRLGPDLQVQIVLDMEHLLDLGLELGLRQRTTPRVRSQVLHQLPRLHQQDQHYTLYLYLHNHLLSSRISHLHLRLHPRYLRLLQLLSRNVQDGESDRPMDISIDDIKDLSENLLKMDENVSLLNLRLISFNDDVAFVDEKGSGIFAIGLGCSRYWALLGECWHTLRCIDIQRTLCIWNA
jgi:hypothetical protein